MKIRNKNIEFPPNIWYIYLITCLKNNKKYCGITQKLEKRLEDHCSGSGSKHLLYDLVNYGIDNFKFEVLEILNEIREIVEKKETEYILEYDCISGGYNVSLNAITPNDDVIDINNINIECKCVHPGVFSIAEYNHSLSYQLLTNLLHRFRVDNVIQKKHYKYKYYQLEIDANKDINEQCVFNLKLLDGKLSIADY